MMQKYFTTADCLDLRCHCVVDGELILAPIRIEPGASVSKRCVVEPGATVPPGVLRPLSTVPLGSTAEMESQEMVDPIHVDWVKFFYARPGKNTFDFF